MIWDAGLRIFNGITEKILLSSFAVHALHCDILTLNTHHSA
jgi:hypothetical protein